MLRLKRAVSLLLIILNFAGSLPPALAAGESHADARRSLYAPAAVAERPEGDSSVAAESATDERAATDVVADEASEREQTGLKFRLSEGTEQAERRASVTVAPAERLSESATANVLKRLPPLKTEADDEKDFALRERSLPPPRTGRTIQGIFPPPVQLMPPDRSAASPLEVVRFAPEGEVPLAPQLSVTFSQPMVAVTSQDALASGGVPVQLMPQPPGRWRWLGTKTLVFDPEGRLPMATEYTATVSAGTRAAGGGTLAATKVWKFATPPPQLQTKYPTEGPSRRDSLIFLAFDQRIEPAAVLRSVRVRAGATDLQTRLATQSEIASDETISNMVKSAGESRWMVIRAGAVRSAGAGAAKPTGGRADTDAQGEWLLPPDARITVTVGPGTPSAEGPRTTVKPQSFNFRTYGPLRVTGKQCGYEQICSPEDAWEITFSNPLDAGAFDKSQLRVTPPVESLRADINYNSMIVTSQKRGRRAYTITLPKTLRDQFGQTLGRDIALTFNVGPAPSFLSTSQSGFAVLEPSASPQYSVYTTNLNRLKVSIYAVGVEDWQGFNEYMRRDYDGDEARKRRTPPGRLISSKTVTVKSAPDEMVETPIDLRPALGEGGLGHAIVIVEQIEGKPEERTRVETWVQVTNIGLDAFVDGTDLLGWATALKDGTPLAGTEMWIQPGGSAIKAGTDGLVRLSLPPSSQKGASVLVARRGGDVAMLPEHLNWWERESHWLKRQSADALRWYVFDDRKVYRPGEEVHVKGWLRRVRMGKGGDVGALEGGASQVSYTLRDSRGNEVAKGMLPLNALGGFDTVLKLPPTMNLGYTRLALEAQTNGVLENRSHLHNFQVQEFRRPEFEVSAKADEGPHFVGGHALATVNASYFAGGGLANAEVRWTVYSTQGRFTPPNRDDFIFGSWTPWWEGVERSSSRPSNYQNFTSRTDAAGKHTLRIDFDSVRPPRPSFVSATASVQDVNRQAWSGSVQVLVHPSELYVGLRSPRLFVQQGEALNVESIVTDLEGRAVPNREIRMRAALLEWVQEGDEWKQKETNPQDCTVRSEKEAVKCVFETREGGVYRIKANVRDDRERLNESELTLWVAGGKLPPQRGVAQEKVELIPSGKEFRPGETAEVLVQSPFAPAEGVLTLRRSGVVRTERFHMDSPSHVLRIPIEEGFTPNVYVQVDLVGAATRTDDAGRPDASLPKRPAFATGTLNLPVPPLARKLTVAATPRAKALEPGGETTVDLEVRDAAGRPVAGGEAAVVVVDEAILALSSYSLPDPLEVFYAQRGADVSDHHLRQQVMLRDPKLVERRVGGGGGGGGTASMTETVTVTAGTAGPVEKRNTTLRSARRARGDADFNRPYSMAEAPPPVASPEAEGSAEGIRLRQDFNALAVFAPSVPTDARGRAEVKVKLPDNLTRYRVMAVSVAGGKQFGAGEATITARQPLMVRPSAPRFLNFGDRFELPIVLQNQTDEPFSVDVAARSANAEFTEGAGRRVTVPANDRVEVRLPVAAARAGQARFQIGAVAGRWTDAAEIELPVWTPATTEAFATYGEIDEGAIVQAVKAPPGVFKQFGGLEITTSSTQLQALTDAVLYLVSYPYECSEQLSSRVLAVAALRDVLTAFKAEGMPKPEEMLEAVTRDIKRLQALQNDDGGFGFWRRGEQSWPYVSVHVAHALQRAKEKNFPVPEEMLTKSRRYLRDIERHIPSRYSRDCRDAIIAYALNVRARMGDRDAARARRLLAETGLENLSLETVGWLLPVLSGDPVSFAQVESIRRLLNSRAEETAGTAHFTTRYTDGEYLLLHSARRTDGIILEALIGDQPRSDLIPKLVRGLLAHRRQGRWYNTQENVFILLALDRYFNTYEKATPDFVARAWLGRQFAGEQEFRGRTTERQHVEVPMQFLAQTTGEQNLVLSKEGAGRLYYRVGMQYAPSNLKLDAADYGFTVERTYEAVDDAGDVRRESDGTWHIKAGARVRVRLRMVAPTRRYHVALVDPLPAGLEALNPALAVTGEIPPDTKTDNPARGAYWWWGRSWFEHQNLRDERAEAFTSLLWEGVYDYNYVARATTPGLYVVPPPKAEEMYSPETFGRGATDRVRVE